MKTSTLMLPCLISHCVILAAHAQGTFQNLNFESANIQQDQAPGEVSVADALPGWTVFKGTNQQSWVGYNAVAIGSTWVTLQGTNPPFGLFPSIQGNFSVLLQGGFTAPYAAISQTGLVPLSSLSMRFRAQAGLDDLVVSLGGVSLPYSTVLIHPNYTLFGCDVSAFANQIEELRFSVSNPYSQWNIDSITFSTFPVPEPSAFALFGLGALLLGWRFFPKRR